MNPTLNVRMAKRWDEANPTDYFIGVAERLPDNQLKIKWSHCDGFFICDEKKVEIVDAPDSDDSDEAIAAVIKLIRSCNLKQIRLQLAADYGQMIGSVSRFDLVRSFFEAAQQIPNNPSDNS
jgi:hypothetical protein